MSNSNFMSELQKLSISGSKLTPEYKKNLEEFRGRFREAAVFLDKLVSDGDLWLSTDQNAHLYCGNKFLGYLKFDYIDGHHGVMFSPKFHAKIAAKTHDKSELIFRTPIADLVQNYEWKSWATMEKDGEAHAFFFFAGPSRDGISEFFDALIALIKEKALAEEPA